MNVSLIGGALALAMLLVCLWVEWTDWEANGEDDNNE